MNKAIITTLLTLFTAPVFAQNPAILHPPNSTSTHTTNNEKGFTVTKVSDVYDVKFRGHQFCKVPVTALKSELEIESAGLELEEIAPIPCGAKHDLLAYTYQHWFTKNVWADFKLVLKGQQDVLAHAEVMLVEGKGIDMSSPKYKGEWQY